MTRCPRWQQPCNPWERKCQSDIEWTSSLCVCACLCATCSEWALGLADCSSAVNRHPLRAAHSRHGHTNLSCQSSQRNFGCGAELHENRFSFFHVNFTDDQSPKHECDLWMNTTLLYLHHTGLMNMNCDLWWLVGLLVCWIVSQLGLVFLMSWLVG